MIARRLTLATLISLCVLMGALALAGVPARAALIHNYLSQITEVPAEGPAKEQVPLPGPLTGVTSMTVDSGHLWTGESLGSVVPGRVDEFDASTGAFISQLPQPPGFQEIDQSGLGVAVGHATGEARVYVGIAERIADEPKKRVAVFSQTGALLGKWTGADTPNGSFGRSAIDVAVDNSATDPARGDVYVTDPDHDVVDVLKPEAAGEEHYVTRLEGVSTGEPFTQLERVAVDASTGDVLVLDHLDPTSVTDYVVDVFEPELLGGYMFVRQISGPPGGSFGSVQNLTVDGGSGEIYVSEGDEASRGVVDEFSGTGAYLGQITGLGTPEGDFPAGAQSVAVDPVSHDVYVGSGGRLDVFGPDAVVPDVTTGIASSVKTTAATLTGTVDLDEVGNATCRFLWGTTTEFGHTTTCSAEVDNGGGPVEVHAQIGGLQTDTTYYYRLQASNRNGTNPGESSQDQHFKTLGAGVHGEAVSAVTAESATLDATIDPNGAATTYYFQYGRTDGYGSIAPAPPGAQLGAGEGDTHADWHVQGLQEDTVYHYRVVAVSEAEPGELEELTGPDQTFTTQRSGAAPGLPDGRQWEMVTPPQKQGALFSQIYEDLIQASAQGNAIADVASQPTEPEPQGYSNDVSVLSTRGAAGWSSQVIAPPHNEGTGVSVNEGGEYRFFSEDLSQAIVQPFGNFTPLSSDASNTTAYLHTDYLNDNVDEHCYNSCFQPLVTTANTPPGTVFGAGTGNNEECDFLCGPYFPDATPDLSHIVLDSLTQLTSTPVVAEGNSDLYEWAAGRLQLISLLPEGEEAEGGGRSAFSAVLGQGIRNLGSDENARHAISDDGSRVIWEGRTERTGSTHLYMRDMTRGETVRLDLPQGGPGPGSASPQYMTASSDGSRIFFLDSDALTPEASGVDLYEYDLDAPLGSRLSDLTIDKDPGGAAVAMVLGASEDGSYLYFAAAGALAPGATPGKCAGPASVLQNVETCNLYVRHAGKTTFIGALSTEDFPDWSGGGGAVEQNLLANMPVRVSPDGHWLAFTSNSGLTGYDTDDALSGRPDEEVYLYDASVDKLVCASCDPTGARPVGVPYEGKGTMLVGAERVWDPRTWLAANVPPWTRMGAFEARYQSRYLSDSGRLFFDSNDPLVPQDVNGTEDVYEYEPASVGDCTTSALTFSERSGGCTGLISSGSSAEESAFLDASETGGDVFFLTQAKLVSQDFDNAFDVYDAHECTTQAPCFASPPAVPPACSTGDSCKAAPSPQPSVFGSPSSATFSGAGNIPSTQPTAVKSKEKSLTRMQKLTLALRACKKKHRQRSTCERKARKRYGKAKSGKAKSSETRASGSGGSKARQRRGA